MPPKAKFGKTEIINAALTIVEQNGIDALTARSLGDKLGSSARPIFTVFSGMDEVISLTTAAANDIYCKYVDEGLKQPIPFKGVGESYVKFASEHPRLFRLLFMKERETIPDLRSVLGIIESNYNKILDSIVTSYGLSEEKALSLYINMWVYTHGIAALTATNVCKFTQKQVSDMLSEVCIGLIIKIKKENSL